ncbi:hypothetical protein BAU07_18820 [Bordetella flabilis]|uniref:Uncharacterized protein n=1 Tax=Bordetella flabilis TaxID=463014 RepID=A0A193GH33_9BORD|nr:hypothetical protein BAU07_18820 [Bordetella flabilis]
MRMPNTAVPCWPAKLSKRNWRTCRAAILPLLLVSLASCSSYTTVPKIPTPAADLMAPVPTGSEYLGSVLPELNASQADLDRWGQTLQDSLTR